MRVVASFGFCQFLPQFRGAEGVARIATEIEMWIEDRARGIGAAMTHSYSATIDEHVSKPPLVPWIATFFTDVCSVGEDS